MPLYLGDKEVQLNLDGIAYSIESNTANTNAKLSSDDSETENNL